MSDVVNAELREQIACVIAKDVGCDLGYSQEFVRCIREIHNCGCAKRADAILSLPGLQAEAPTDAEVAEIEKRHADCEGFYAGHGGYRPDWHKDRATLLRLLKSAPVPSLPAVTPEAVEQMLRDWIRDHAPVNIKMTLVGWPALTLRDAIVALFTTPPAEGA